MSSCTRSIDWHLMPYLWLLYMFCVVDRVNIGLARVINYIDDQGQMERDLGMSADQYNWAVSIFYVGYILFEVPSNLLLHYFSPRIWISRIAITWGICASCMAAVKNVAGMYTARMFLGLFEAGLVPGISYYLSTWYRKEELGFRMGLFFSAASFASALGGLLAFSISHLDGKCNLAGWRWIYLLEGLPSIVLGILGYWMLPNNPSEAKFLNDQDKIECIERLLFDDDSEEYDSSKPEPPISYLLTDLTLWGCMICFLGLVGPGAGLSVFLATILKEGGLTGFQAQLYTCPPTILAGVSTIATCLSSDKFNDQFWHLITWISVSLSCMFSMNFVSQFYVKYIFLTIAMSGMASSMPLLLVWASDKFLTKKHKLIAMALIVSFGNIGGALSGHIYRQDDAPNYMRGHFIVSGCLLLSLIGFLMTTFNHMKKRIYVKRIQDLNA